MEQSFATRSTPSLQASTGYSTSRTKKKQRGLEGQTTSETSHAFAVSSKIDSGWLLWVGQAQHDGWHKIITRTRNFGHDGGWFVLCKSLTSHANHWLHANLDNLHKTRSRPTTKKGTTFYGTSIEISSKELSNGASLAASFSLWVEIVECTWLMGEWW